METNNLTHWWRCLLPGPSGNAHSYILLLSDPIPNKAVTSISYQKTSSQLSTVSTTSGCLSHPHVLWLSQCREKGEYTHTHFLRFGSLIGRIESVPATDVQFCRTKWEMLWHNVKQNACCRPVPTQPNDQLCPSTLTSNYTLGRDTPRESQTKIECESERFCYPVHVGNSCVLPISQLFIPQCLRATNPHQHPVSQVVHEAFSTWDSCISIRICLHSGA